MTSKGSTLAQVQAEWEDDRAEDSLQDYLDAQNREMDAANDEEKREARAAKNKAEDEYREAGNNADNCREASN
ncbi:MAG: hypothetical protein L6R42_000815 [Xanthoria sp. 1 TBL-2021]|nr:MAG: hypothetical protein L6R42_000815 [Xanthoria sp. 1 TBL-2021]